MRALIEGRRNGSVGAVLGLAGVICLLIASVGLNLKHAGDLDDVKHVLVSRCELRQAQDVRTRDDLTARIELYATLSSVETIPDAARAYREAREKAQAALDSMPPPVDCTTVYAHG